MQPKEVAMTVIRPTPTSAPAAQPVTSSPAERNQAAAWTGVGIAAIWTAVTLISVFAPDLVSGIMQDHVPLAAILTWIWGVMASRSVATAVIRRRRSPGVGAAARLLAIAVSAIWTIATVAGVFGPEWVTGTDPTHFPISAVVAPIAALLLTQLVVQLITAFDSDDS
jgi:hypothetical protein